MAGGNREGGSGGSHAQQGWTRGSAEPDQLCAWAGEDPMVSQALGRSLKGEAQQYPGGSGGLARHKPRTRVEDWLYTYK